MSRLGYQVLPLVLSLLPLGCMAFTDDSSSTSFQRPNVLLIAIDDLRTSLGCYGDPLAKSPNIDQFAATARRFHRAYVQQAVCGPSRTSLLTGRLPDHTCVWHNRNRFRATFPNLVTLPQLFKQHGYRTLAMGKVFSGNEAELDPVSWSEREILLPRGGNKYVLPQNQGQGKQAAYEAPDVGDDAYADGVLANLAVATLEHLARDRQSFFLAVGFFKPHLPFNAPRKYWDLYDAKSFALPGDIQETVHGAPEIAHHSHRELGGYRGMPKNEQLDARQIQQLRHGYYACVSYVDAQVGKVLRALQRLELDQNTIVVVWGDHGYSLGEMSRWCKGTNFELDTRVPLLIRTPDLPQPGVSSDALVEIVDLYPTLAGLTGLPVPSDLDGRSFAPILDDSRAAGRDVALSQFSRPWKSAAPESMGYSIRTVDLRYTCWVQRATGRVLAEELYDYSSPESVLGSGPHWIERKNIAADQPELLDHMRGQMDTILRSRIRAPAAPRRIRHSAQDAEAQGSDETSEQVK